MSVLSLNGSGATRSLALAIGLAATSAALLVAQTPPTSPPAAPQLTGQDSSEITQHYRFRLLGVYDEATGEPVEGVEVSDVLSGVSSLTTNTGTVSLFFLPNGGSLVRLRKIGYEMQTFTVAISPADTAPVTVVLTKAVQLATVNVKAAAPKYLSTRLNGAMERMKSHAGGYFIDEAEMRKHDNSTLAMMLPSRMPGMMTAQRAHSAVGLVSTRAGCPIHIIIDGTEGTGSNDVSRMYPYDYAIAEFYPGGASVPIEYSGTSKCGVLLLWTRER